MNKNKNSETGETLDAAREDKLSELDILKQSFEEKRPRRIITTSFLGSKQNSIISGKEQREKSRTT